MTVAFQAWVAEVHDPCILRLDFLRFVGCTLKGSVKLAFLCLHKLLVFQKTLKHEVNMLDVFL